MKATAIAFYSAILSSTLFVSCDAPGRPRRDESENREAIMDFHRLYENNCSGCHGTDGKNGPARILNDALYLSVIPRETLREVVVYGRPGTSMPGFARSQGGALTDKQVDALVDGIYTNWSKQVSAYANAPKYAATGGDPAAGKRVYAIRCFMCHGKGAKWGSLTDQNYLDLVSSQMIRTSVIVGRPDLGMPNYKQLALNEQSVTDVVAYLDSLRQNPAPGVIPQPTSPSAHTKENGSGNEGPTSKGNEGSGNGPGSPRHEENEGIKGKGSNSQRGVK